MKNASLVKCSWADGHRELIVLSEQMGARLMPNKLGIDIYFED